MDDPRPPAVDRVLSQPALDGPLAALGRTFVRDRVRAELEWVRQADGTEIPSAAEVAAAVTAELPPAPTSLRRVINATGIIVHTNLGRAPLSDAARAALAEAAGTTDVELDLETGRRSPRGAGAIAALSAALGGAATHVVNNGAAALVLACHALAPGGNIVLSRGEMVEIGDGFRIPELLSAAGVEVREVGTTNRTNLDDYRAAIDANTGFVLKVFPSNFRISGFTGAVGVGELAGNVRVPVVADVGSGLLRPHPALPDEPDVLSVLHLGADLVVSSGDKLLGGPQAGIMVGDAEIIERLRRHPLARALRVDKLTLAALEATLTGPPTPVAVALTAKPAELLSRAHGIAGALNRDRGQSDPVAFARPSTATVGGGGAPGVELPSAAVALSPDLARPLRVGTPPVVGHIRHGELLLDLLAVPASDDEDIVAAVRAALDTRSRR